MSSDPTRAPLPPPFSVGARLRYVGKSVCRVGEAWTNGKKTGEPATVLEPGIVVTVDQVSVGRRGTGRVVGEYDDGPMVDETRDGWSAYTVAGHSRLIRREHAHEWEQLQAPVEGAVGSGEGKRGKQRRARNPPPSSPAFDGGALKGRCAYRQCKNPATHVARHGVYRGLGLCAKHHEGSR